MIALFFEVLPRPGQEEAYFQMAARLKPALDQNGGVRFLDRSRSLSRTGWLLSHQLWDDESSMVRWRENPAHHRAQVCGRTEVMADYRLRVARVVASTVDEMHEPLSASNEAGQLVLSVLSTAPLTALAGEVFRSVYDPALHVTVVSVSGPADGSKLVERLRAETAVQAAHLCRIIRDYGMYSRTEAPQVFPPASLA